MRPGRLRAAAALAALATWGAWPGDPAAAHPLSPSLLEITEAGDGRAEVVWKTPLRRAPGVRVEPELPARCHPLGQRSSEATSDSVTWRWSVACGAEGLAGQRVGVRGLAESRTDALVRITLADGRLVRSVLRAREPFLTLATAETAAASAPTAPASDRLTLARAYAALGLEHILGGADHLLFVFGLLLLVSGGRQLLWTVTAFTLGHSVTLSLAALGLARLPSRPVELLIALSVFVLAVELTRPWTREGGAPSWLGRRPWALALGFGLLHGLGFAGALSEVGLPTGEIPLALACFNAGIELGQLAFVAAVLLARALLTALALPLPGWSGRVPVYAMGILAWFWCLQRLEAVLA